jgi:hypothetical protein
MTEQETYVSKQNPTVDDWLAFNEDYFAQLKGEGAPDTPNYAPLVDVDQYAAEAKISTEDYFEQVKKRVGSLGRAGLQLVHSEMDDAWHIVVAPIEVTT